MWRALIVSVPLALTAGAGAQENKALDGASIKALIITGHNNHNWRYTSRIHEETLAGVGRFAVDVTDDPQSVLADAGALAKYSVFVLDYNDMGQPKPWGEAAQRNFTEAVRGGKGVVVIHSANNAFDGWKDYEQMVGLLWRKGTGHGKVHEFTVSIADKDHPITRGMADFTTTDELYHKLVNTQNAQYRLLAQAQSSAESGGTGANEPMAITLEFGKGRIFHTPLGHVWNGQDETKPSVLNPAFRALVARGAEWAATGAVTLPPEWTDHRPQNTLTEQEKSEGWVLLFDGVHTPAFRGYKQDTFPATGWAVRDGMLVRPAGPGSGDIVTIDQYQDFEFSVDWRATPGANSGIIYHCTEEFNFPWETGLEMQILDDAKHPDGKKPKTRAGTLYDLFPTDADVARPAGAWNHARVVCKGTHIEHWLNGFKVVDVDLNSDRYRDAHKNSKWPTIPNAGTRPKGHIALQDHGDEVHFRNIKVRPLK